MSSKNQELEYEGNNITGVLIGVLIGGLAGAFTMLLMAPQSGKKTRTLIQKESIELRDRASDMVEDTVAQVRARANKFSHQVKKSGIKQVKELKQQGQELVVEQLNRVSALVKDGKTAVQNA